MSSEYDSFSQGRSDFKHDLLLALLDTLGQVSAIITIPRHNLLESEPWALPLVERLLCLGP